MKIIMEPRRLVGPLVALALLVAAPAAAQTCTGTAKQIVTCEQKKAGGAPVLKQPLAIAHFLRNLAASLNAAGIPGGPFGVLVKTSGSQCAGYSCDIICTGNGSAQKQWDVLKDAGGKSEPTWDGPLATIAVRPCEFVAGPAPTPPPAPAPPVPAPTPADLAPILARLTVLERQVAGLHHETADIRNVLASEVTDIRALMRSLPAIVLPPYKGSLWGIPIVSKPCPECAR